MTYSVLDCPVCNWSQISFAKEKFKCRKCNASRLMYRQNILYRTKYAAKAREFLQKYNIEKGQLEESKKNGKKICI